ncbi:MAG: NAD(P)/FAD-dependent oxidoreductase [Pirellulales bacterium]|jgi:predicted Rossmann fold flavoprotein|nr:NAD(P)/FAD-dependent oxidoreductase [Thermoguttaceae bacterium]MDD4785659.1 NAD(P)/FAD-dependent oxidoreductase [Pirellulales bacterium]MDI9446871.1 NAD(P)/FAD-dependent oxidoreductase [Planctomycetota bacterium]NLZ00606.1 NAD(P)/FAD-dependent oxidoreductase [Pirellulaceae bacterium]
MDDWSVVVVGGGPAGLLAACRAAARGRRTLLLEKNRRPGVKILISGGGHCNLTQATDARGIVMAFGPNGRFLHSALAALGPRQLVELFEAEGVRTEVEPGGKVFPASRLARHVLDALMRCFHRSGATLATEEPLVDLQRNRCGFRLATTRRILTAETVVLATGGCSYPRCGTTGEGYRWVQKLGHTIVAPRPALTPIVTDSPWIAALQGIAVPDVLLTLAEGATGSPAGPKRKTPLVQRRGAILFAHFGLSGPVALDLSRAVSVRPRGQRPTLLCDLLPETSESRFEQLLAEEASRSGRRRMASILEHWLPRRLADALVVQARLSPERRSAEVSRPERRRIVETVKRLSIRATGTLGFEKAEVTAGGVALEEIDSRTMQSKRVAGLFLAGELLDLDGPIGGYNLQAAFSTGHLAGENA